MNDDSPTTFMKLEWGPNWIHRLLRPTLAIVSIVLLLIAAKFGYSENPAGMAAAATPALFCLVFVFLPYFSEVAILGFKAKLLDQKIVEAESALTHLKSVAVIVARAAYQTLIYGNRMTFIPVNNKRQVATELDQILRSLSIDGSVLKLERDKFLDMHMFDIALFVEQAFRINWTS